LAERLEGARLRMLERLAPAAIDVTATAEQHADPEPPYQAVSGRRADRPSATHTRI
jgi:hypothetical protein